MMSEKKETPKVKTGLHPRNKHRGTYNFDELVLSSPDLAPFVFTNQFKSKTIDFANPKAVKQLNTALLKHDYGLDFWDIPENHLCPAIPGRVDYIHHLADLVSEKYPKKAGNAVKIKCLDIGTGANCIYPILGVKEYNWNFVASETDSAVLNWAQNIIAQNTGLSEKIELRLQNNRENIFQGIIQKKERFDVTLCNPPFHGSEADARKATLRKQQNLKGTKISDSVLNFGGAQNELWVEGGETAFILKMIKESTGFKHSSRWFTTLVSKKSALRAIFREL